jgi:hypothetical protein
MNLRLGDGRNNAEKCAVECRIDASALDARCNALQWIAHRIITSLGPQSSSLAKRKSRSSLIAVLMLL